MLIAVLATSLRAESVPVGIEPGQGHLDISVHATVDSFVARLQAFNLSVSIAPQSGLVDSAVFRFHFGAINTGNSDRDRDMNQWQQTELYPEVVYNLASLEPGEGGKLTAHGRLRFHGRERSVVFPVSIEYHGPSVTIEGDTAIDTRDYGLPVIRKYFFLRVDPLVHLHFHLHARRTVP